MKKFFMAIALCLICAINFIANAQRLYTSESFVVETVDEFGDPTGNKKVGFNATGYFSNSATTNSNARIIISFMESKTWLSLYEYDSNHASDDDFDIIFTGTKTKDVVKCKDYCIPYNFVELCKANDTITIKMTESGKYATTTAVFKLYKCKDFYKKYIETFGEPNMIQYQLVGDHFLKVYSKSIAENDRASQTEVPSLTFNKEFIYEGKTYYAGCNFDGKFSNGNYITVYGTNVKIDGIRVQMVWTHGTSCKLNDFLSKLKPESIISVEYENDPSIKVEIKINQELYDQIINFYK